MHEIKMANLNSLSIFVGTGECNAHCAHCAGIIHRKYAPKEDGVLNEDLIRKTIRACYETGARYLSISGSGEPTLSPKSVTKLFDILQTYEKEGIIFSPINLYSNGIRIGSDETFSDTYLPLWKSHGLTTMYITVHDIDEKKNAKAYCVDEYPKLETVISRIHSAELLMRANIVLRKGTIYTFDDFKSAVTQLKTLGADSVSAWSIRGPDDKVDHKLSPLEEELDKMEYWVQENQDKNFRIRLLREKNREVYETGQKLTLFPDGTLSSTWCN